jgi:hypothetical protein
MGRFSSALVVVGVVLAVASCSSDEPEELDDPDVVGRETNPDGVAYPTDRIGGQKRIGKTPGDRIPNLTFRGYPDGDRSRGLQTISLADYFDPTQQRYKILHIQVAATWCSICSSLASATVIAKEPMGKKGVAYVEVFVAGATQGFGPSMKEVDDWVTRHQSNFTTVIDVRARRLAGIGVTGEVIPWDIVVDTRTMEILDSAGGAPADVVVFDNTFLDFVDRTPPSY